MIDAVITRLQAKVPELAGRIEGAADFAELMRTDALPAQTPAAHVIPLGYQGGAPGAASGYFTQEMHETIGVIVTLNTYDATGRNALAKLDQLIRSAIDGLCGWAPNDEVGVFQFSRAGLVRMSKGALVYQIEFSIADQLRVQP